MLGLGLSLQKGVSAFNAGRALVSSYIRRVTSDGGVLQNTSCDVAAINELNQDRLLEPASWVLVPDGIKEDVVYAQKPSTGLGDLTFTRASDATYTDSTGVVRRSPYNLLQQSNTFNATWVTALATVTSGQSGFDGTNNAWLLSKTNTDGRIGQSITLTSGAYTYSVYAKAGTKNWVFLRVDGTSNRTAYFNLQTGVTGTASGCTSSISSVGNGWYRCSITFTDSMTIARIYVADANNDTSGTSGNILIQAAQLVEGTSALDYFPTTNRQDVPRIDFRNADGTLSSCGRLLLEPQRTNSIRNSSMVGAVAGSPGTLPTNWAEVFASMTRSVVGVGTENGLPYVDLRFNGTTTSSAIEVRFEGTTSIAATTGQAWTLSPYVKLISGNYNSASLGIYERTSAGTIVVQGFQTIVPTSTLQRFVYARTLSGGATVAAVQPAIVFGLTIGQTYDFTIRIAAPQMELGAYATTWVPTTTAAVTRIVDAFIREDLQTNGILSSTGLTWYTRFRKRIGSGADAFPRLEDAAGNNVIGFSTTANTLQSSVRTAGGSFVNTDILLSYNNQFVRACFTLSGTTLKVFVNGILALTTTAPTSLTYTRLRSIALIEKDAAIDESLIVRTPLSDNECEVLTSDGYATYALLAQSLNCVLQ